MANLLDISDLEVSAAGNVLLEGVRMRVAAGEVRGVQGASGSGKTRLLRAIATIDPSRGALSLQGRTPTAMGFPEWRRQVIWISQRPRLHPGTVESNLLRPFTFRVNGTLDRDRAHSLLRQCGLPDDVMSREADTLSEGEQQRVCLVRALVLRPRLLLLDEPTSALDPGGVEQIEQVIAQYTADETASALLVSHDPEQMARFDSTPFQIAQFRVEQFQPAQSQPTQPQP